MNLEFHTCYKVAHLYSERFVTELFWTFLFFNLDFVLFRSPSQYALVLLDSKIVVNSARSIGLNSIGPVM